MITERNKMIFEDYLITNNLEITGIKFGISKMRVSQIVRKFDYKKPKKEQPSPDEKKAVRLMKFIQEFWKHVEIRSESECWNYNGFGVYGNSSVKLKNKREYGAHRLAWIFTYGEIEEGFWILHTCDNKRCCNPSHLYKGTSKDNSRDRQERFYKKGLVPLHKKNRQLQQNL